MEPTEAETETTDSKPTGTSRRVAVSVGLFLCAIAIISMIVAYSVKTGVNGSRGSRLEPVMISFHGSESVIDLSDDLLRQGIIGSKWSFLYYLYSTDLRTKLQAGDYDVSGTMSIPEIVSKLVRGDTVEHGTKVTFPEGMSAREMAARLDENGLPGAAFLQSVTKPNASLRSRYPFLADAPPGATLEGFLFPDTYYFDPHTGSGRHTDETPRWIRETGRAAHVRFDRQSSI